MRTKTEKEEASNVSAEQVLDAAEREELEQLRAERDERIKADQAKIEAEKRAATSITLNLPPAGGKGIHMAGKMYYHGRTYNVSNDIKWALEEAERRCWAHESSLHESENKGRKQRRAFVASEN